MEAPSVLIATPRLSHAILHLVITRGLSVNRVVCMEADPEAARELLRSGIPCETGWTPDVPTAIALDSAQAWELESGKPVWQATELQEAVLWSRTGSFLIVSGYVQPISDDLVKIHGPTSTVWGRTSQPAAAGHAELLVRTSYLAGYTPIVVVDHVWYR